MINNKSYIGKTKSRYGNEKAGSHRRWSKHLSNCFSDDIKRSNDCPLFCKDNFVIEDLVYTNLETVDNYETSFIDVYQTCNRNFGYNIAEGGKGRSVVETNDETRLKISESQRTLDGASLNITPDFRDDKHVGYRVRRVHKGKEHSKRFTNTKFTIDENLQKAKEWLECFEEKKELDHDVKYNKESDLPKHIFLKKDKKSKEPIGYEFMMTYNKIKYNKSFTSKKQSLDVNLQKAIDYKEHILNTYVKTTITSLKEEQENPHPSP